MSRLTRAVAAAALALPLAACTTSAPPAEQAKPAAATHAPATPAPAPTVPAVAERTIHLADGGTVHTFCDGTTRVYLTWSPTYGGASPAMAAVPNGCVLTTDGGAR